MESYRNSIDKLDRKSEKNRKNVYILCLAHKSEHIVKYVYNLNKSCRILELKMERFHNVCDRFLNSKEKREGVSYGFNC